MRSVSLRVFISTAFGVPYAGAYGSEALQLRSLRPGKSFCSVSYCFWLILTLLAYSLSVRSNFFDGIKISTIIPITFLHNPVINSTNAPNAQGLLDTKETSSATWLFMIPNLLRTKRQWHLRPVVKRKSRLEIVYAKYCPAM